MPYYHDLITVKSWSSLKELASSYKFILIGGWAVYLYTNSLKSKDIDLVMEFEELEKLRQEFEVVKNERLKKYEAKQNEVDIDIYVPFYSNPGLPAEKIGGNTAILDGFRLPQPEILLILKQQARKNRQGTIKGRKDLIDILSLLDKTKIKWSLYKELLQKNDKKEFLSDLIDVLNKTYAVEELNWNRHTFARLKKGWLSHLT